MSLLPKSLIVAVALSTGSAATAQDSLSFDNLAAGLRVIARSSIYEGGEASVVPVPNFGFSADIMSVGVEGIRIRAFEGNGHRLDAMLRPRFAPYDADESPQLAGMERDFTADLGLRYAYTTPGQTQFSLTALGEVTGEHDGYDIEVRLTQGLDPVGLPLAVFGGVTYRSEDLSNFLYGVRASEAMAGRPAYDPGDTVSSFVGVSTLFPVSDRFSITGAIRTNFYQSDVLGSPIVAEDTAVSGTLGFLFRF